ncbi:MAG: endonuclease Q family protein [Candidatus Marsarchaeota archaeon]|jgi:uncharacterized protein (TIGR00375 family)|nr:endonuclease Q family protein [Candidatus Marsarchaeota archaeon]MCL5112503.1 endonuclease Q family protein [Candidatus Marsarchaeota archaeon]
MKVIADLHTHSRYAMACSSSITIKGMEATALEKGISLVSTADFTHGGWLAEIKRDLEDPEGTGLLKVKGSDSGVRFILGVEVSTVFNPGGANTKKIHHCILLPSIEHAEAVRESLSKFGAMDSDGRPTLSMGPAELVENVRGITKDAVIFPAHAWTPFFGVFGAFSGFDSMEEAYEDQAQHIHALEMGLSSDSPMNWRISKLDKYTLLGNSDMHSLPKMGREANVFDIDKRHFNYRSLVEAINSKDRSKLVKNIEFYPEEGKYHFDGHRNCHFSVNPEASKIERCPICGKRLVIGVLHRVNDLADRPPGVVPQGSIPYVHAVPLMEVIAYVTGKTSYSRSTIETYTSMISALGPEFDILLDILPERIAAVAGNDIANAIMNVRNENIGITPGYNGVFGVLDLLNKKKGIRQNAVRQKGLSDFTG